MLDWEIGTCDIGLLMSKVAIALALLRTSNLDNALNCDIMRAIFAHMRNEFLRNSVIYPGG